MLHSTVTVCFYWSSVLYVVAMRIIAPPLYQCLFVTPSLATAASNTQSNFCFDTDFALFASPQKASQTNWDEFMENWIPEYIR